MSQAPWISKLLQLTDPALPIGAYAHSLGLEGLVQGGHILDAKELAIFLQRDVLASACDVDLPIIRLARQALEQKDFTRLEDLDNLAWASRQSRELREASSKMGRQLVQLSESLLYDDQREFFLKTLDYLPRRQNLTVLALYQTLHKIPLEPALSGYAWQMLSGFAQAGLKLLHLGPFGIQKILTESLPHIAPVVQKSLEISQEEVGGFLPIWDISSSQHEYAPARLFIS